MKLSTNKEIIHYLHRHYYPFQLLSKVRLKEAEELARFFKLKKNEHIELGIEQKGDHFYILSGSVQAIFQGFDETVINADELIGKPIHVPETATTIRFNVLADCIVCHINNDVMDHLLSWNEIARLDEQTEISECIESIRNSLAFRRLPLECVGEAFKRMKRIEVKKGEEIIRQGEEGDTFYLIKSGRAEVWVQEEFEDEPEKVWELGENDSFGEYALLAEKPRSATVRMTEDGVLLALERYDFIKIFSQTLVHEVDISVAKAMIDSGHELIDVRFQEEYDVLYIPQATLIPLNVFRENLAKLDKTKKYVIHCRSGKRSRVAALLMTEQGYDAVSMQGGIIEWPFEKKGLSIRSTPIPKRYR
jgi:rhodanese-related sulfurtransferase/mannose-6-phosphate isomerase-like protein (cupin superfamily)